MREGTEYRRQGTETLNRGQRTEDRGQEAKNREVQLGTADRRQGIEMCDMGQRTGDNEQSCKTGDIGRETNSEVLRQETYDIRQEQEMGTKDMGDRKRLAIFLSPVGMSLTKLSLVGNNENACGAPKLFSCVLSQ